MLEGKCKKLQIEVTVNFFYKESVIRNPDRFVNHVDVAALCANSADQDVLACQIGDVVKTSFAIPSENRDFATDVHGIFRQKATASDLDEIR